MQRLYFDYAAATPVAQEVLDVMQPYFTQQFYNPSALYEEARKVKSDLESARASVARLLGARPSEIIFTAGGSESTNLAVRGIAENHPDSHILVSAVEHEAVLKPAARYNHSLIPVNNEGIVDLVKLKESIRDDTVLVSVMMANNEVGTLQPISEIAKTIESIRQARKQAGNTLPLYFHTDACQTPLYLDVNVGRLGIDLMTLNGGKMHGPKQSGILYVKAGIVLRPIVEGGGQEFGYRQGTENVAFAVGFAKALELAGSNRHERVRRISSLQQYFIAQLESHLDVILNGHRTKRIANNVHVSFPGTDNERVLFALDELGIAAAAGSACSASSDEPSHVLQAMGISEDLIRSSIRFSLGSDTTQEGINQAVEALKEALNR